ncbi:MAG: helix-turn-helix domain-containing protein [Gammaproteobacteria bacterium]|nr:helix-turn-helix domain-containing protein [Gammaproteobacteria bacterium]
MKKENMYHYTSCGLRNIWLRNGFVMKETSYGHGVAIHDVEGLHKAIGLNLVQNKPHLSGAEIRFLRKELDMPQAQLAAMLGVSENTIRGWEKHRGKITKPAERLLRMIYQEYVTGNSSIRELIERLGKFNRNIYSNGMSLEETENGWVSAA